MTIQALLPEAVADPEPSGSLPELSLLAREGCQLLAE